MIKKLALNTPTVLLKANPKRRRLIVQMQAELVDPTNTGKIFIGLGFQPVGTVGHSLQGEILIQSAALVYPLGGNVLESRHKGTVWALSDTASQSIYFEEEVEVEPAKP